MGTKNKEFSGEWLYLIIFVYRCRPKLFGPPRPHLNQNLGQKNGQGVGQKYPRKKEKIDVRIEKIRFSFF